MKDKSTIIGAALAALALVVIVIGIVLIMSGSSGEKLPDPDAVLANLPSMTPEDQEKEVLKLDRYDSKDPRADQAIVVLRKIMKDQSVSPLGRAAAIRGLGAKNDYDSLPDLAECLSLDDDKDFVVRKAAVEACNQVMKINMKYDPAGPPDERKRVADDYMANAQLWKRMKSEKGSK